MTPIPSIPEKMVPLLKLKDPETLRQIREFGESVWSKRDPLEKEPSDTQAD